MNCVWPPADRGWAVAGTLGRDDRSGRLISLSGYIGKRAVGDVACETELTPRAPEPPPKSRLNALDVSTRSERPHPDHDLHSGNVSVPVAEKPGPHRLNSLPLR